MAIPADLLAEYEANKALYALYGKLPPVHYDETVAGQVTVTNYETPAESITLQENPENQAIFERIEGEQYPQQIKGTALVVEETGEPYNEAYIEPESLDAPTLVPESTIAEAGIGGAIPFIWDAITGLVGGKSIGDVIMGGIGGIIGGAAADTAIDALGSGNKEYDIGGDAGGAGDMTTGLVTGSTVIAGVPFGGPGVPEPPAALVGKMWKTKSFSNTVGEYWVYHWLLIDGRQMSYNAAKKQVKVWRPKHNITLGPKPRVKDLIRINKSVNRLNTGLRKQLKKAHVEL